MDWRGIVAKAVTGFGPRLIVPSGARFLAYLTTLAKTGTLPERYNIKFPEATETTLNHIWQIVPGTPEQTDTLYCGVEPAALFPF